MCPTNASSHKSSCISRDQLGLLFPMNILHWKVFRLGLNHLPPALMNLFIESYSKAGLRGAYQPRGNITKGRCSTEYANKTRLKKAKQYAASQRQISHAHQRLMSKNVQQTLGLNTNIQTKIISNDIQSILHQTYHKQLHGGWKKVCEHLG